MRCEEMVSSVGNTSEKMAKKKKKRSVGQMCEREETSSLDVVEMGGVEDETGNRRM